MSVVFPSVADARRPKPVPAGAATGGSAFEFGFEPADYERVRHLIHAHAGISLNGAKQAMVYSRLSRRLRQTGHTSFASYLQSLEDGSRAAGAPEWQCFVNALTTNLTSFFREAHHFQALARDLTLRPRQPLRVWCNAASTGEEPYSIAMTLRDALGSPPRISLLATDIDTQVLATARRGVYPAAPPGLPPERMHRHFLRGKGVNSGLIRVKPELADGIEFRAHNLADARWALGAPFDIVFCRNVLIYFDTPTQHAVLERMHRAMKPGGRLYVGHSESFSDAPHLFRLCGKTIYERV